jgi:hypothetical protein
MKRIRTEIVLNTLFNNSLPVFIRVDPRRSALKSASSAFLFLNSILARDLPPEFAFVE